MATGLRAEEKEAIVKNFIPLLNSLKVGLDDVTNWLYQNQFFTDSVKEDIECGLTPQEKAKRLLTVVQNTDHPHAFSIFTQALKETNHKPTARLLQEAAQDAQEASV